VWYVFVLDFGIVLTVWYVFVLLYNLQTNT
jgi:hypothetical protein